MIEMCLKDAFWREEDPHKLTMRKQINDETGKTAGETQVK